MSRHERPENHGGTVDRGSRAGGYRARHIHAQVFKRHDARGKSKMIYTRSLGPGSKCCGFARMQMRTKATKKSVPQPAAREPHTFSTGGHRKVRGLMTVSDP